MAEEVTRQNARELLVLAIDAAYTCADEEIRPALLGWAG